jgi:Tfp pilus assembly PilM family ATPase
MRLLWRRRSQRRDADGDYYSVLDLGASAVKALVVEGTGDRATILGRAHVAHPNGIATNGRIGELSALQDACERALIMAEDATGEVTRVKVVPDTVLIAVPTAWVARAVGIGRFVRPNLEETITSDERREPIERAGRIAADLLTGGSGHGDWRLLDATVLDLRVDGRRVTDFAGFRGHTLEAAVQAVAAPGRTLAVLAGLADALKLDPPHLVAEPMAIAAALGEDGLVIQVGARTTSLVLVRHGVPMAFGAVLAGGSALIDALADAFRLSPSRAAALLRAYGAGRLQGSEHAAVRNVLAAPLASWLSWVVRELRSWDVQQEDWVPEVYLCGGASVLGDLQRLVSSAPWLNTLPLLRVPSVRTWDGSNLSQVADRTMPRWQLDGVTSLAVAAWPLRDRGPGTADGILRSTLRIGSAV